MKLLPVTKLDWRNKTTSKKIGFDVMSKIVTSLSLFGFLANLEQYAGLIPDKESAKVIFSVIVTFCFTKTELFYANILQKNADSSTINRNLAVAGIFSETKYGYVLMCQI